jgi:hypothetical protein
MKEAQIPRASQLIIITNKEAQGIRASQLIIVRRLELLEPPIAVGEAPDIDMDCSEFGMESVIGVTVQLL